MATADVLTQLTSEEEVSRLRSELVSVTEVKNATLKRWNEANASVVELKGENQVFKDKIESLNQTIEDLKRDATKKQEDLKQEMAETERTYEQRLAAVKKELTAKYNAVEEKAKKLEDKNLQLQHQMLDVKKSAVESTRQAEKDREDTLKAVKEQARLTDQLSKTRKQFAEYMEDNSKAEEKFSQETLGKTTRIHELQERLNAANEKNHKLEILMKQSLKELAKQGKFFLDEEGKTITPEDIA